MITVKAVNEQAGLAVEIECSDQWFEGFLCRPGIVSTDEGPWDRGFEALLGPLPYDHTTSDSVIEMGSLDLSVGFRSVV